MTCLTTVETKRHQQDRQESQSLIIDDKTLCDKKTLIIELWYGSFKTRVI